MNNTGQFLFSSVLEACLSHGTGKVVSYLKYELLKTDQCSSETNSESFEEKAECNINSMVDKFLSETDSNLNSSKSNSVDALFIPSKIFNRKRLEISLHVESLVSHPSINCDYKSNDSFNSKQKSIKLKSNKIKPYIPSTFQNAILSHMHWQRNIIGHRIGLIVMATALGKTIVAILDIQREIMDIHHTFGNRYCLQLINNGMNANEISIHSQHKCECPCMLHNYVSKKLNFNVSKTCERIPFHYYLKRKEGKSLSAYPMQIIPFCLVFIVHTKAIRNSAYFKFKKHFQALFNNYSIPNSYFLRVEPNTKSYQISAAKFIFILFQSFNKLKMRINDNSSVTHLQNITHVIIDEVHHLLADTWKNVHKCLMDPKQCPSLQYCMGMTATLYHRTDIDGKQLKSLFANIIYLRFPWIIAKQMNFFPDVEYLEALPTLKHGRDTPTYAQFLIIFQKRLHSISESDFNSAAKKKSFLNKFLFNLENSLKNMSMVDDRQMMKRKLSPMYVVQMLMQYQSLRFIHNQSTKHKILIFAATANDATQIANICNANDIIAGAVHYKVCASEVTNILHKFRFDDEFQVLVNVNVVNEGYDLPIVDCVIFARITKSEIIFVQQLGCVLRKHQSKKEVCVFDLALNLRRRWKLLQTTKSDEQIIQYINAFWDVQNFVGLKVCMSPTKGKT